MSSTARRRPRARQGASDRPSVVGNLCLRNKSRFDADRRGSEGPIRKPDDGQRAPRMNSQRRGAVQSRASFPQRSIEHHRAIGEIEQPHPSGTEVEIPGDLPGVVGADGDHGRRVGPASPDRIEGRRGMSADRCGAKQRQGHGEEKHPHQQHRGDRADPTERDHRTGQRVTEPYPWAGGTTAGTAGEAGVGIHSPPRRRGVVTSAEGRERLRSATAAMVTGRRHRRYRAPRWQPRR